MPRKTGTPFKLDLEGQKFGRWTVVKNAGCGLFLCRCECGTESFQYSSPLKRGASKSCGCLALELATVHGMEGAPTYYSWTSMKQRCGNPKAPDYHRYGGRGIKVCDRWQSFENFVADMGERPKGKTLGRIDNDGPYSPDNCQWETLKRQARNRRNTTNLSYKGEQKPLADWAEEYGISRKVLANRIKQGWPMKAALSKDRHGRWGVINRVLSKNR